MTTPLAPARRRVEFGDWQTPLALARAVTALVGRTLREPPRAIVEPTCGLGSFLLAASERFPAARLHGYDISAGYVERARASLPSGSNAHVAVADVFDLAWEREFEALPDPVLVLGNPPWVTTARLGALGSSNAPARTPRKGLRGLDALTGRSNFDVSEWVLVRMLDALQGRDATVAMLCKRAVARRVMEYASERSRSFTGIGAWAIDAALNFDATVDACLFAFSTREGAYECPVFASLDARLPDRVMGVVDGALVPDVAAQRDAGALLGRCEPEWRSGLKHDCASVMELTTVRGARLNGLGAVVDIEEECVHPLLKGSDVANGRLDGARSVIVTQRRIGDDTGWIRERAPRTWAYLEEHRSALDARRSSIYRGRPAFAMFGVGDYSFMPWKVAVCALYKRLAFTLVGPVGGRPVMLDDTCYFLPFARRDEAERAITRLRSARAAAFFEARVFWDAKRPITKAHLQSLDIARIEG